MIVVARAHARRAAGAIDRAHRDGARRPRLGETAAIETACQDLSVAMCKLHSEIYLFLFAKPLLVLLECRSPRANRRRPTLKRI